VEQKGLTVEQKELTVEQKELTVEQKELTVEEKENGPCPHRHNQLKPQGNKVIDSAKKNNIVKVESLRESGPF
jgi:hypothetical protein